MMKKNKSDKKKNLEALRHSAEHVLTQAMLKLYPGLKMAMGPATDDGFYFDFDYKGKISEDDFPKIEKEMQKIIDEDLPLRKKTISIKDARKLFKGNKYKNEWLDEIKSRGEKATIYWTGDKFVDLCSGPHVKSTSEIKAFKLLKVAGAYWRGSEKNKMLTRIYGTAFYTKKELNNYINLLKEAKKRDHRKLGKELDLFLFDETSPGMPYWLPKGLTILLELINYWRTEHIKRNYQEVRTPLISKKELFEKSGHWDHYRDNMFISTTEEDETYAMKPMNCPNAMIIFGSKTRSYRELPLRLSDTDTLHRYERSGTLNGLLRVREFSQDDAHIFLSPKQIKNEYKKLLDITEQFYSIFNLQYSFRLGTRPEKYMGKKSDWNKAEKELKEILKESKKEFSILEGDGAFYGPKIDILMKDALGREWQMGTMQLDFQIPKRFNLKYSDQDNKLKTPVVIHRVIYGSFERFVGILIEHFAGAFPVWLSPVQVKILPISEKNLKYASDIQQKLLKEDIRVELDDRNETLSAKIRDAQKEKIPYMIIIGKKEEGENNISVRLRNEKDLGQMSLDQFKKRIEQKIKDKSLSL